MNTAIIGIGTANPVFKQDQTLALELVSETLNLNTAEKKILQAIYKFTGIKTRYSVLSDACRRLGEFEFFPNSCDDDFPPTSLRMKIYKQNALNLALSAIKDCLYRLENFDKNKITHLITVSCTGMYAPGLDIEIIQHLGLSSNTQRTAINFMGCYGAFNGIKIADAICKADSNATVLVVCVEICTIHFQKKTDLDNLMSNAIFADGASCVLIQQAKDHKKSLSILGFHCDLVPNSSNEMAWHVGDSGFEMVLTSYVPEAIGSGIAYFLKTALNNLQLKTKEIDFYAIHPGAKKILKKCEQALEISKEKNKYAYHVLENYGNMSSATILFVLKALWQDLTLIDSDKTIFSCGFGPGLTFESMMLKTNYV